jgi:hypothetical protein
MDPSLIQFQDIHCYVLGGYGWLGISGSLKTKGRELVVATHKIRLSFKEGYNVEKSKGS